VEPAANHPECVMTAHRVGGEAVAVDINFDLVSQWRDEHVAVNE
jgi:hypothetical protein